jgi:hypothetical protein
MSRLAEIQEKRARLVREAAAQRRALAEGVLRSRGVLTVVDRGLAWGGWLRARPYLAVAAAAALAVLRPKLTLGWSARLLTLWKLGRLLYGAVKPVASPRQS